MMRHGLRSRGHTLLELTIAVALGLVVTAGAVSLYRSQRTAYRHANDAAQIHEAGMTALTLIGQQLQMAGFTPADGPPAAAAGQAALFGCSAARAAGTDDRLTCEALSGRSDGIAIRYVADNVATFPSASGQSTDCLGQGVVRTLPDVPGAPVVNRYYAKASASTGEPELYCEGSGKVNSAQPLVEGIERLRFRYWPAGALAPLDAVVVPATLWSSIVAVDLCVLVRGMRDTQPGRYVDCESVSSIGADGRARQAFWRRVAIRNMTQQ
jgi:type IV pilus assembly protein PilW